MKLLSTYCVTKRLTLLY